MAVELALRVVRERAQQSRADAMARWAAAVGTDRAAALRERAEQFAVAGRLTLNFHPDRFARSGSTVAAGLLRDGSYRSQWATGISNGSRSAILGGDRQRFERALFGFAYEAADADVVERPVYGAFDLLGDPHGGSPRFGSCCLVLAPHVRHRTTLCVGDSHASPHDVGTFDACWSVLAGLAEQAATGSLLERALGVDDLLHSLEGPVVAEAPARRLDGYVEAQVHGGVDLATDVDAVVLDPSFAGTHIERDLAAAAERHGFALCTHGGSELRVARRCPLSRVAVPARTAWSTLVRSASPLRPRRTRRRDPTVIRPTPTPSSSSTSGTRCSRTVTTPGAEPAIHGRRRNVVP
jgi:hypothetical protein